MSKQSFNYEDAVYRARELVNARLTGSGAATTVAGFTNMKLKSVTLKPVTAGTSNDVTTILVVDGTTTTTFATATLGSGGTSGTNVTRAAGPVSFGTNGYVSITKGTDATLVLAVGAEVQILPGADVEDQ